jgi:hypothetical protein
MLLLVDRAFDSSAFFAAVTATGAHLLARITATRNPPVLAHLSDGSYLSWLDGLEVRIIEADLTVTGADGSRVRERYRLVTSLLYHRRFPATDLIRLYHERWEIESAYLALRHTLLDGHVLRSGDRPRSRARDLGSADRLSTAAHGHGDRGGDPARHQPRPGQLHHRSRGRTGANGGSPRHLPRRFR